MADAVVNLHTHWLETSGWHRIMKDNSIGSTLPECLSFILNTFQIDQTNCILVHFPVCSVRHIRGSVTSQGSSSRGFQSWGSVGAWRLVSRRVTQEGAFPDHVGRGS